MVLVGVHERYDGKDARTSVAQTLAEFPLSRVIREFTASKLAPQNVVSKMINECKDGWANGQTVVWSFKPDPDAVLSGAWTPYFKSLAAYLRDNPDKPTILSIWHEPENDVPTYFDDGPHFVRVFNKFHDDVVSVYPGAITCHIAMAYRYADSIDITDAVAPKWRTKAKLNAVDVYSGRTFKLNTIMPEQSGFKRWFTYVAQGGEFGVMERGFQATVDDTAKQKLRADTIRREADWMRNTPEGRKCVVYVYWNSSGPEYNPHMVLDTQGEDALRYLMEKVNEPDPIPQVELMTCPLCVGAGEVPKGNYTIIKAS